MLNQHSARQGATLPLCAAMMVALLLMLGFVLELGWLNFSRFESQSAADLASKSALATLYQNEGVLDQTVVDHAKQVGANVYNRNSGLADCDPASLRFGRLDLAAAELQFSEISQPEQFRSITASKFNFNQEFQPILGTLVAQSSIPLGSKSVSEGSHIELVLCVDASRSMNYNADIGAQFPDGASSINEPPMPGSRWFALTGALESFFDATAFIGANGRLGLVSFGGGKTNSVSSPLDATLARRELGLGDFQPRTSQVQAQLQSYLALPALGFGTSLYDGLDEAIRELGSGNHPAKRYIILLADGAQTPDLGRPDPLVKAAEAAGQGITILTVGYDVGENSRLVDIANATGGQSFFANSPQQLEDAFGEIANLFKVRLAQ